MMKYEDIEKILDSIRSNPAETFCIILILIIISIIGVYLKSYLSERAKSAASKDKSERDKETAAKRKAESGIQISKIKTGKQSPFIIGDKATITYGVSLPVVDDLRKAFNLKDKELKRLLKTLDEKDVSIEDRDAKLQELARKYKELEERLAKRSAEDELVAQAKQNLEKGDLEGAEKLLLQSLEKNLQAIAEKKKAAAADAFELGSVKELQLDYAGAKKFYEQAVQLEPDNTKYLNSYGIILHELGRHKEAIEHYEKALAIDLKVYGDQHPNV